MAQQRVLGVKRSAANSYTARACVPYGLSLRFAEMTADSNPLIRRGVVSGFFIDSVVAAAFESAIAGQRKPGQITSICSKFGNYFMANSPANFAFAAGPVTAAGLVSAKDNRQLCSVSISYGEPYSVKTRMESLEGMQGMMEYSFSREELDEFCRMTGSSPGARYAAPMLALSFVSNAAYMGFSPASGLSGARMVPRSAGPLSFMGYEMQHSPPEQNTLDMLAKECLDSGEVVYTSHTATFFREAHELLPSEIFHIYVDCSGIKEVPGKGGSPAGVRGSVKADAVLGNGERLFECSAGILARKAR